MLKLLGERGFYFEHKMCSPTEFWSNKWCDNALGNNGQTSGYCFVGNFVNNFVILLITTSQRKNFGKTTYT